MLISVLIIANLDERLMELERRRLVQLGLWTHYHAKSSSNRTVLWIQCNMKKAKISALGLRHWNYSSKKVVKPASFKF